MLNTIQELEKEIEQFHRNIKDSNELIEILRSVALITKEQTESFEKNTNSLYDELTKMPPEMCAVWENKVADLVEKLHAENLSYQTTVSQLLDGCIDKVSAAEEAIAKVPALLEEQNRDTQTKNREEFKQIQLMNKAINIKLSIALGGVAIAIIVSIIALFI